MNAKISHTFGQRIGNGGSVAGSLQVRTGPGVVRSLRFYNGTGGDVYLQIFDTATTPAVASVPDVLIGLIPNDTAYETDTPLSVTDGCFVAASDTPFTYTANAGNVAISAEIQ